MRYVGILATVLGMLAIAAPALSDTTPQNMTAMMNMMMAHHAGSVSVQGGGDVDYTPDQARVTLAVNGEAATAAAAAADVANRANAVIGALKNLGIGAADITTTGFNLYYRQAAPNVGAAYVASESVNIKTSVDKVGTALDAGIRAGANQSYGLSFDSTKRDALYKQAVQRAIQNARDLAQAAAASAGVKLGSVQTIEITGGGAPPPMMPMARMAMGAAAAPPPMEPGTSTMHADVTVTYWLSQ